MTTLVNCLTRKVEQICNKEAAIFVKNSAINFLDTVLGDMLKLLGMPCTFDGEYEKHPSWFWKQIQVVRHPTNCLGSFCCIFFSLINVVDVYKMSLNQIFQIHHTSNISQVKKGLIYDAWFTVQVQENPTFWKHWILHSSRGSLNSLPLSGEIFRNQ